jgi:hypothetical protein
MKVEDLPVIQELSAEPNVIEIKPGARYLLHIKANWPRQEIDSIARAIHATGLNIILFVNNSDISLYDVSAVVNKPTDAEIDTINPLDD